MAGRTAIGLDIGTTGVRAAQVSVGRDGQFTLDRFGQVALPPGAVHDGEVMEGESVTAAIKQLWSSVKFSTKDVTLGVANQRVAVRQVDLPWMAPKELKPSLKFAVADLVPMPVDEAVLDFVTLQDFERDGARLLRGLLVAASEDMVMGGIDAARKAGLAVRGVDLTPFALLRALGREHSAQWEALPEALVDVGARVTNIVIHEAGVPQFVRILLRGGDDMTDYLVERLGIPPVEADHLKYTVLSNDEPSTPQRDAARQALLQVMTSFVDEIRGSVDYHLATSGSRPLSRLLLSGGGARLTGLPDRLQAAVRTDVHVGGVFHTVKLGNTGLDADQLRFVEPMAAVPVGLALGGATV